MSHRDFARIQCHSLLVRKRCLGHYFSSQESRYLSLKHWSVDVLTSISEKNSDDFSSNSLELISILVMVVLRFIADKRWAANLSSRRFCDKFRWVIWTFSFNMSQTILEPSFPSQLSVKSNWLTTLLDMSDTQIGRTLSGPRPWWLRSTDSPNIWRTKNDTGICLFALQESR